MNYLILYSDENNKIIKEIHNSAAISLSHVHANLIARKNNRKVVDVKLYDTRAKFVQALNDNDLEGILETIAMYNEDEYCTINHLEELAINDGIYFTKIEKKYNVEQELIVDDYDINLLAHWNAYGLIILDEMTVKYNNKVIIREEFKDGKKRAI